MSKTPARSELGQDLQEGWGSNSRAAEELAVIHSPGTDALELPRPAPPQLLPDPLCTPESFGSLRGRQELASEAGPRLRQQKPQLHNWGSEVSPWPEPPPVTRAPSRSGLSRSLPPSEAHIPRADPEGGGGARPRPAPIIISRYYPKHLLFTSFLPPGIGEAACQSALGRQPPARGLSDASLSDRRQWRRRPRRRHIPSHKRAHGPSRRAGGGDTLGARRPAGRGRTSRDRPRGAAWRRRCSRRRRGPASPKSTSSAAPTASSRRSPASDRRWPSATTDPPWWSCRTSGRPRRPSRRTPRSPSAAASRRRRRSRSRRRAPTPLGPGGPPPPRPPRRRLRPARPPRPRAT